MAALINYGLSEKKSMARTAILTIELLLLSTGLVSTFFMLKKAINPRYLFDIFLVNLRESLNSLKSFLSSPLYICLFINSVVILILTFSKFQHPIKNFLNVFLNEKDADGIQITQPQHHEKVDMPNRTNSAIAMDTVMSFFSRYNSHPSVLEDIQDEMSSSVKDIEIDSIQTACTFSDISHLSEASEIKKPRSPHPPQITTATKIKTKQQKFEEFKETQSKEEEELEDDSLEATWKAITNKKKELKKSLTFNDALSMSRIGGAKRGHLCKCRGIQQEI
uniref:DUF4408 domain-containing protein n=1 Tax=Nicotiana tabacum TaxID=4097 RepID=A0A1S4AR14_TOBAC|nr:PREDICTED: uncharacterized protein LOC107800302 [Nicotiana tabacum]